MEENSYNHSTNILQYLCPSLLIIDQTLLLVFNIFFKSSNINFYSQRMAFCKFVETIINSTLLLILYLPFIHLSLIVTISNLIFYYIKLNFYNHCFGRTKSSITNLAIFLDTFTTQPVSSNNTFIQSNFTSYMILFHVTFFYFMSYSLLLVKLYN
jgi:hypothetical protein